MAKKRKIHQNKTGNENNFWHQSRNVYGVGPVLAKDIRDLGLTLKVMKTLQTHTGYEIDCYCRLILLRSMYDFFNWNQNLTTDGHIIFPFCCQSVQRKNIYRRVVSSNTFCLEPHPVFCRFLMLMYIVTFWKKILWLVIPIDTRNGRWRLQI